MSGPPWDALDRLRNADTRGVGERAVLLAAARWADAHGVLWPALGLWAELAGVRVRTLQRCLRNMVGRGVVEVVSASPGGSRMTSRYRVPLLARNPDKPSGVEPRPGRTPTPTNETTNPDGDDTKPRQGVGLTTRNPHLNLQQQPPAVDVLSRLGIQNLREHPNATPERLAWIGREASTKANPGGWAAACIREGWAVPAPTEAEAKASRDAGRAAKLAEFDALPASERAAVLTRARRSYPNLDGHPEDSPAMRGAVLKVWNPGAASGPSG